MRCEASLYGDPKVSPQPVPVGKIGTYFSGLLFADGSIVCEATGFVWETKEKFLLVDHAEGFAELSKTDMVDLQRRVEAGEVDANTLRAKAGK